MKQRQTPKRSGLHLESIRVDAGCFPWRDRYPCNLPLLAGDLKLVFEQPVTFFAGENGTGKSTLLRAVSRACGIHIWETRDRRRCNRSPDEEALDRCMEAVWRQGPVPGSFFSSETFTDFSRILDEFASSDPGVLKYFGGASLVSQSHGQSILSYFRSRYTVRGLYLIDEPETALSPASQILFVQILAEAAAAGDAQFIVASHSPIVLACPGAVIYSFDETPPGPVAYEETEYFRVYREFLGDREKFLGGKRRT